MGEAAKRKEYESKLVVFDFTAPKVVVSEADRNNFGPNYVTRAVKFIIQVVVNAAFPNGMEDKESDHWEVWQEFINDPATLDTIQVSMGEVVWLKKLVEKEDLKVPVSVVQWRRALARYLATVKPLELVAASDNAQGENVE